MKALQLSVIVNRIMPSNLPETGTRWGTELASALTNAKEVLRQLSLARLRYFSDVLEFHLTNRE